METIMQNKSVALVTGANRGIGLQIAKDLTAQGYQVLIGTRDPAKGEQAAGEVGPDARAIQLDVTDQASITAAAERIESEFGRLDVLVNNAGIAHTGKAGTPLRDVVAAGRPSVASLADMRRVWDTNVFGVVAVTQAMLPLLRKSAAARVVNISSSSGSLTWNADPDFEYRHVFGLTYSPSKAALNAVTLAFAIELEPEGIKVNAVCPGFTSTEFNNYEGTGSVEEGAQRAVQLALQGAGGPTGTFSNSAGTIPW
jgi:NAD(P)-dependent dehydrogenase (short-subunit alcohol dehydrogenase family)